MNEYGGETDGSDGSATDDGESGSDGTSSQVEEPEETSTDPSENASDDASSEEGAGPANDIAADATSNFAVREATTFVDVRITEQGEADYFEVEITGDAHAQGRLYRRGDLFRLNPYEVQAIKNAEDLTRWRSDRFNGAQLGDRITVTVRASIDGVSTVVHERTDYLGPSEVEADLNYIFDETNNKVRVILTDPGNADHVKVRFEEAGDDDEKAVGTLEEPGDELVIANTSIGNRPEDRYDMQLDSSFIPGFREYGHANFTEIDDTEIATNEQIRLNGTAVIESKRARTSLKTQILDVTNDLSGLQEIQP